jgi:hypothetical protein
MASIFYFNPPDQSLMVSTNIVERGLTEKMAEIKVKERDGKTSPLFFTLQQTLYREEKQIRQVSNRL